MHRPATDATIYLDPDTRAELLDDEHGLALVLTDGHGQAVIPLPRGAATWLAVRSIAQRIEALEPKVRMATIGYRPEYGPHTGPCGWTP